MIEVFSLYMSEGISLKAHLDKFNLIIMDLENCDVGVEDEDQAILLLCRLPSSYKNFQEIMSIEKEMISVEEVKAALFLKEFIDKELTSCSQGLAEALVVKGRPKE